MDPQQIEQAMEQFSLAMVIDSSPQGEEFLAYRMQPQPWAQLIASEWALAA